MKPGMADNKKVNSKKSGQSGDAGLNTWKFRSVLVVCIPVILVLLLEMVLRVAGYGYPAGFFIKREIEGKDFYTDNFRYTWTYFPSKLARTPNRLSVPVEKAPGTYRIFVLGESAAVGDPDTSYSFSRILEIMLEKKYPDTKFEIVNSAVTAINSNVLLQISKDCAKLKPDLFILYMGNNEVIGPFGPGTAFTSTASNRGLIKTNIFFKTSKIGQLFTNIRTSLGYSTDVPEEWSGMEMFMKTQFRADDSQLDKVYSHFKGNLDEICDIADKAGAKVITCTYVTNLKDCAPFASQHDKDVDSSKLTEWDRLYKSGKDAESQLKYGEALKLYKKAAEIDDGYAELQYRMGRCYSALKDYGNSKKSFIKARDLDTLRFRADSRINEIIREISAGRVKKGVYMADAEKAFEKNSTNGITGGELLLDHVHMNFKGNYLLASTVLGQVEKAMGKTGSNSMPSEEECAKALAYTGWDQLRVLKLNLERLKTAPFTNQMDHNKNIKQQEETIRSFERFTKPGGLEETLEAYTQAVKLRANDWVIRENFGKFLMKEFNDAAGAAQQFEAVLKQRPFDYMALDSFGVALSEQNKIDAAIDMYEKSIMENPNYANSHSNLGKAYISQKNTDMAIEQLNEALRITPNLVEAHLNMATLLLKQGKTDEAIDHCKKALKVQPDMPEVNNTLGSALSSKGQYSEALKYFTEALRVKPNFYQAHANMAISLISMGKTEEAVSHLTEAIKINGKVPQLHNMLGKQLMKLGKTAEAIASFEEAIKLEPNYTDAKNNLQQAKAQSK